MHGTTPDYTRLGRVFVLAVLIAFMTGFGSGAVTVAFVDLPDLNGADTAQIAPPAVTWTAGIAPTARINDTTNDTTAAPHRTSDDISAHAAAAEPGMMAAAAATIDRTVMPAGPDAPPANGDMHATLAPAGPSDLAHSAADAADNLADEATADALEQPADGEPDPAFLVTASLDLGADMTGATPESAANDVREVTVRRGDTLSVILQKAGIERAEAHAAITALDDVYDPRRLRVGQELTLETANAPGGVQLAGLSLNLGLGKDLQLTRSDDGAFAAASVERELHRELAHLASPINDSLYLTARRFDMPQATLHEMIRLFSWDVDFQRDIRVGAKVEALYERLSIGEGGDARGGDIMFAALDLNGRELVAYRFVTADGTADYFDADGRSMRKSLMRTPINGARMSSRFGKRRHPVLGYTRMHKGTDFAAPRGTPIYAAGSGTITMLGRNGGYGKYVRIRHNGEYATAYAHMTGYAKGLAKGSKVKQGQVIGYVGTTGVSTGPHLHYEVLRQDEQINPMSVKQVAATSLTGEDAKRFHQAMREIDSQRDEQKRPTRFARNEM